MSDPLADLAAAARGYQAAILQATGLPYPWPALDLALAAADAAAAAPKAIVGYREINLDSGRWTDTAGEPPPYRDRHIVMGVQLVDLPT